MLKRLRLWSDQSGTSAVEVAIAAPVALAILFAVIDVGRTLVVASLLDDAVRAISRQNQVKLTPSDQAGFTAEAQTTIQGKSFGLIVPASVVDHDHLRAVSRDPATFSSETGGGRQGGGTMLEDLPLGSVVGSIVNPRFRSRGTRRAPSRSIRNWRE